jgi:hypothetical protein
MNKHCMAPDCGKETHSYSLYCFSHDPAISDRSRGIMERLKPVNERLAYVSEILDRKPTPLTDDERVTLRKEEAELYKKQSSLTSQYRASRKKDGK